MGNFEKLVVLTVLFLSAIVLAVQLGGDDEDTTVDPSTAARRVLEGGEAVTAEEREAPARTERRGDPIRPDDLRTDAPAPAGRERSTAPDAGSTPEVAGAGAAGRSGTVLLDSAVGADRSVGGPVRPARSPYGPDSIVVAPGLEPAGVEGLLVYQLERETSWEALAEEIYGDARYAALLALNNEESFEAPTPGPIVVPMQDNTQAAGIVSAREPRRVADEPAAPSPRPRVEDARPSATPAVAGLRYEVQEGDNLSKISERFFGSKARWEEIYQANRDLLDSPDWVKPGMTLVIPGAKAPAPRTSGVR